jgi:hypothetical protein
MSALWDILARLSLRRRLSACWRSCAGPCWSFYAQRPSSGTSVLCIVHLCYSDVAPCQQPSTLQVWTDSPCWFFIGFFSCSCFSRLSAFWALRHFAHRSKLVPCCRFLTARALPRCLTVELRRVALVRRLADAMCGLVSLYRHRAVRDRARPFESERRRRTRRRRPILLGWIAGLRSSSQNSWLRFVSLNLHGHLVQHQLRPSNFSSSIHPYNLSRLSGAVGPMWALDSEPVAIQFAVDI